MQKFSAIIVDPDATSRMRLKSATTAVIQFGGITLLSNTREAMQKLQMNEKADVIFVSFKLELESVVKFITEAKNTKGGEDAAYILILGAQESDSSTVAGTVMVGADGFLFEPYSVDQLVDITELASKVKKERSSQREKVALKIFISDIIKQVDLIAYLKSLQAESAFSSKKFKDKCEFIKNLTPETRELYFQMVVDMFEEAPMPASAFRSENYRGASARVKKKIAEKAVAEFEKISKDAQS